MAVNAFDVITYGNGDFLRMVFNGVAAIFGEDDYMLAMRTAALLGFLAVLIKAAFSKQSLTNFTAFMGMLVFYMAVVVPKINVQVVDRITKESFIIANVPIGLGATASFFSITGDYLARKFETIYSLPNGINYSESGMLFPQSTFQAAQNFQISDPELRENMQKYMLNCVYFDGLGQNRFSPTALIQAKDLMDFFEKNTSKNVTQFIYTDNGVAQPAVTCSKAITNYFKDKMYNKDQIKNMLAQSGASFIQRKDFKNDADVAAYKAKSKAAFEHQFSTNQQYDSMAVQFSLINELQPVMERFGQEASQLGYIFKKAKEDRRLKNTTAFAEALWTLPKMRDLYEAFLYAIFPIVILMSLVLPAKVPVPYITMLVWINLWAPIYSIIHFAITYWTRASMLNSGLNTNGFNALNVPQLAEHAADMANIAAWLAASTPVIAYMIVSKSGAMMSQLTSRAMQGYEQAAAKASDEIVAGKGTYHGVSWTQNSTPEASAAMTPNNGQGYTREYTNSNATGVKVDSQGNTFLDRAKSELGVDINKAIADTERNGQAHAQSVNYEKQTAATLSTANDNGLHTVKETLHALSSQHGKDSNYALSQNAVIEKARSHIKDAAEQYQRETGVVISADAVTQLGLEESLGFKAGIPVVGVGPSFEVKGTMGAGINTSNRDSISTADLKAFKESNNFSDAVKRITQDTKTLNEKFSGTDTHSRNNALNSTIGSISQAQLSHNQAVHNVDEMKSNYEASRQYSTAIGISLNDGFKRAVGDEKLEMMLNKLQSPNAVIRNEGVKDIFNAAQTYGFSDTKIKSDEQYNRDKSEFEQRHQGGVNAGHKNNIAAVMIPLTAVEPGPTTPADPAADGMAAATISYYGTPLTTAAEPTDAKITKGTVDQNQEEAKNRAAVINQGAVAVAGQAVIKGVESTVDKMKTNLGKK